MKNILVWIFLISEVFSFPTQSTDSDKTQDCCAQNPKLIYKGQDSDRGINVYVFEFLPQSKEVEGDRGKDPTSTENGENHEDTTNPTNKPASIYSKKKTPVTETSTGDNIQIPDLVFDTITVSATQNDIEMFDDSGLLSNATEGRQTGMSHTRDVRKTNGNDYYGTEGSALPDIPDYNDTDTDNQVLKVDLPANVNDFSNNLGCSQSEGQCKNLPISKGHIFVTQPTKHKDPNSKRGKYGPDGHEKRERKTKNRAAKQSRKPTKANKRKSEKKPDSNVNTKDIPIRDIIGKIFQYYGGQRRKIGGNQRNAKYSSSSESRSESSQESD